MLEFHTRERRLTSKLTDRHELTYEKQKLQGKSPGANGGSVQRLVRSRHRHNSNLHFLQPPDCNHADKMNNDEKYAVPIAEQIPVRSKGNIPAVLGDEIYSVNRNRPADRMCPVSAG